MNASISRRAFLATTASAVAASSLAPALASAARSPEPRGVVYARTLDGGIPPGSVSRPSRGPVRTLDGHSVEVGHVTAWRIGPDKGVLLAPDEADGWSILYAEA